MSSNKRADGLSGINQDAQGAAKTSRRSLLAWSAAFAGAAGIAPLSFGDPWIPVSNEAAAQDTAAPTPGGAILWGRVSDSTNLDIAFAGNGIDDEVTAQIHEGLIADTMEKDFEPILAESWEISEDGLTYTFRLRQGITFHDGTEFNADAVKSTYDHLLDPATASPNTGYLLNLDAIEVVEPYVVRLVFTKPYAPMLTNLASVYLAILSPAALEQYGEKYREHPVGTGPFMFGEWVVQDHITLVRYDGYQNFHSFIENQGAPYLDEVTYRVIPEVQTQIASIEAGELNFLPEPPASQVQRLEQHEQIVVFQQEDSIRLTWLEFMFVHEGDELSYKPPFDDIRLRQAVGYAIDPQQIITGVLQGLGIPDNTPMPVGIAGYDPAIGEQYGFTYDPERARTLLQEAGDPGEIVVWSFLDEQSRAVAQLVQNQLQTVGFTVKLEFVEEGVWVEDSASDNPSHHLAVPVGFGGTDPDFLYTMTDWTEGIGLYFKYNPEFRELVTQARETLDMEARLELYDEAQRLMLEDASFVPIYSTIRVTAVRTEVKNFELGPYGKYFFQDVFIEQ